MMVAIDSRATDREIPHTTLILSIFHGNKISFIDMLQAILKVKFGNVGQRGFHHLKALFVIKLFPWNYDFCIQWMRK